MNTQGTVLSAPSCSVETCDRPIFVAWSGLCSVHHARLWQTGTTDGPPTRPRRWRRHRVTYEGAQSRLRSTRGPASAHLCAECGAPASQWKLLPEVVPEIAAGGAHAGLPYSSDPREYGPLCVACLRPPGDDPGQGSLFELDEVRP